MGYFKDTLKGIGWMGALQVFVVGTAVIKVAILARFLSPSQFGVYGIALLILGLLEVLTETGINVFLIQEKDDTDIYLNSAWVVSILRGFLITLLIFLSSPFIVFFFKTQGSLPLFWITALVAFVRGFINPMEISFQKNLQFFKFFLFKGGLYFVDASVAIILGILTKSEYSMIFGMLAAAFIEVILSFLIFKRPKIELDWVKVKKVINRGKWITGAGLFGYLFQNIDNIVVGKLLGTNSLGLYQQAYRISTLPVSQVSEVFNKVTFPVYVQIQNDKNRLKNAFTKTFLVIAGLSLLFGFVLFLFSHQLILFFLGAKWISAEPVLKVLAVFGIFKAIINSSYSLFLSLKKQNVVMYSELFGIMGISLVIIPLSNKYGLIGVGYSVIFGVFASIPIILINLKKIFRNEKD